MSQRIWVGSSYRSVSIDFPRANEYFDTDAILVLRTAFELYKRDDLLSDLVAHFRRQADAAAGPADGDLSPAAPELDPLVERFARTRRSPS